MAHAAGARDATHAHLSYQTGGVFLGIGPLTTESLPEFLRGTHVTEGQAGD